MIDHLFEDFEAASRMAASFRQVTDLGEGHYACQFTATAQHEYAEAFSESIGLPKKLSIAAPFDETAAEGVNALAKINGGVIPSVCVTADFLNGSLDLYTVLPSDVTKNPAGVNKLIGEARRALFPGVTPVSDEVFSREAPDDMKLAVRMANAALLFLFVTPPASTPHENELTSALLFYQYAAYDEFPDADKFVSELLRLKADSFKENL